MTIIFRYKKVKRPDNSEVRIPSIPIQLMFKEKFDTIALLDSGADISAIPLSIAEIIGIDLSQKRSFAYGIGGKVESIETKINIIIEKGHEKYAFEIPIKVILDHYDFPVILGREGFFDKFVITFNQNKEKISLKYVNNNK